MKKLKLVILTMILSLVIFAGVNVMAMDEDTVKTEEPKAVISEEAPKGIEGGNTAEEVKAEEKEEIVEEGNKEASAPSEDKTTKTDVEKVDMGGVPSSNIDTDKAVEPEDKKPSDAKPEEKANEEDKKSEDVKPDEKKDDNTEEKPEDVKPEDAKKDAEAEVKPEEEKKTDEAKEAEGKTEEEKAKEVTEEKTEEKTDEGEKAEANAEAKELEVGTVLDPDKLTPLGAGPEGDPNRVEVGSFKDLVKAINDAQPGVETTIIITQSFEITETIKIGANKIIVLTSKNEKAMDDKWKHIEQPKDYSDYGEKKQREIIDKARERGDEAIKDGEENITEDNGEYYYTFEDKEIILKRAASFIGTMFDVKGSLTLGDKDNSISFDGNKEKVTLPKGSEGQFFKVNDKAKLTLTNGVIANGKAEAGYSAAVSVEKGGEFTMEGGRISSNYTYSNSTYPTSAGAVYVSIGGKFNMKNGMIDHNTGSAGAISAGDLYGVDKSIDLFDSPDAAAIINLNGGNIVSNSSQGMKLAGGIVIFPAATLNFNDGIVAGNSSSQSAGGITISDQFVGKFDNSLTVSWVKTRGDYEEYKKHFKAEANINGGLIYKNKTGRSGGGLFIDSNYVHFNRTMILNNKATLFGGAVYVSFPPRIQELKDLLITENNTIYPPYVSGADKYWGGPNVGGGIWNCPDGHVHIGDGHSVYVFNNNGSKGSDYVFSEKTDSFLINKDNVADRFYNFISPVTKDGNIIKFLNDDGTGEKLPYAMSYTREFVFLKAVYDKATQAEAWRNSGTFIMDNKAAYGAGIGSDASLETPEDKGDVNFKFKKHWDPSIDENEYKNKKIHADIYIVPKEVDDVYVRSQYGHDNNLFKYGEVILSRENNWETTFSDFKGNKYTDLPAFTKDNGLPFTPEELAAKGLKYLVIERETEYSSTIEEKYTNERNGKIEVYRDLSVDYEGIDKLGNPDYYLYYVDEFGRAHYLTKAVKEGDGIKGVFAHPMLDQKIVGIEHYGTDRNYVDEIKKYKRWIESFEKEGDQESADYYRLVMDLKGYKSGDEGYAFFLKRDKEGLKLYVPYLFIENWDEEGYSGFNYKVLDNSNEQYIKTYTTDITNRPYTEAKFKKTWKMLTEEEIREALGQYRDNVEVKNREIPDQVTFYVLKDKKRIVVDYIRDKNGKVFPVYKTVTLTKKDNWEGTITKLDPYFLDSGAYGIEEEAIEGFKMSYKITKTKDKDKATKLSFRVYVPSSYKLFEGYDKDEKDYTMEESLKDYFDEHFGDIKINLVIDGKVTNTKIAKWNKEVMDLTEYGGGIQVFYSLDSDNILFGFDGEEITVYTKGRNIRVEYYNSMDNAAGLTNYNIYLEKDKYGGYTLYAPNLLKKGKFYQMFQITEKDRNSGYIYPMIKEFKAAPYKDGVYTFLATNEELPPEPEEPTPRKTFVKVRKVWEALGETRDIQVELYINGEASGKFLTLNAANGWSASFTNLDLEDESGRRYTYTVKEVGENDNIYNIDDRKFEVSYSGDMYKGFTILNREVPPEEPEEPEEEEPEEPHEPEEEKPEEPDKHVIPKTGVTEDVLGIFLGLMILLGLVYIKRKYIVEKSK